MDIIALLINELNGTDCYNLLNINSSAHTVDTCRKVIVNKNTDSSVHIVGARSRVTIDLDKEVRLTASIKRRMEEFNRPNKNNTCCTQSYDMLPLTPASPPANDPTEDESDEDEMTSIYEKFLQKDILMNCQSMLTGE